MKILIVLSLISLTYGGVIKIGHSCKGVKRLFAREYETLSAQLVRSEGAELDEADFVVDKMKNSCILETVIHQETSTSKIFKRLQDNLANFRKEYVNTKTQYEFLTESLNNWYPDLVEFHHIFIKYLRVKSIHDEANFSNALKIKEEYQSLCKKYLKEFSEENPETFLKFKVDRVTKAYEVSKGTDNSHLDQIITTSLEPNQNIISVDTFYEIHIISIEITTIIKTLPSKTTPKQPSQQEFDKLKMNVDEWYPNTKEFNGNFIQFLMSQTQINSDMMALLNKDRNVYTVFCQKYITQYEKQNSAGIEMAVQTSIKNYLKKYFKQFENSQESIFEMFKMTYSDNGRNTMGKYIYNEALISDLVRPILADYSFKFELSNLKKNLDTWYPLSTNLNGAFVNFLSTKKISAFVLKQITTADIFINSLKGQLADFCSKYKREVSDDIIRMIKIILEMNFKDIQKDHSNIIKVMTENDLQDVSFLIDFVYNEKLLISLMPSKIEEINWLPAVEEFKKLVLQWHPYANDFIHRVTEYFYTKKVTIEIIRNIQTPEDLSKYLEKHVVDMNQDKKVQKQIEMQITSIIIENYPSITDSTGDITSAFLEKYKNGPLNFMFTIDNHDALVTHLEVFIREHALKNLLKMMNVWSSISPEFNEKFIQNLLKQKVPIKVIMQCTNYETFESSMKEYYKTFITENQNEVKIIIEKAVAIYVKKIGSNVSVQEVQNQLLKKLQENSSSLFILVTFNEFKLGEQMKMVVNQIENENKVKAFKDKLPGLVPMKDQKIYDVIVSIFVDNALPLDAENLETIIQILRRPGIKVTKEGLEIIKLTVDDYISMTVTQKYPKHYKLIIPNVINYFETANLYKPSLAFDKQTIESEIGKMNESITVFIQYYELFVELENGLNQIFKDNKEFVTLYIQYIKSQMNADKGYMSIDVLKNYGKNPLLIIDDKDKYFESFKKAKTDEYHNLIFKITTQYVIKVNPTESNKCIEKLKYNKFFEKVSPMLISDNSKLEKVIQEELFNYKINECSSSVKGKIDNFLTSERAPMEMVDYFNKNQCILTEICGQNEILNDNEILNILKSYKAYANQHCYASCGSNPIETVLDEVFTQVLGKESFCSYEKLKRIGKIDKSFLMKIIDEQKLKTEFGQFLITKQSEKMKTISCL